MKHDDYVCSCRQRFPIARLLIPAVTVIAIVPKHQQSKPARQFDSAVRTVIVPKNADVDQIRQFTDCDLQSLFRIVGGQHNRYAFAVDHEVMFL